MAITDRIAPQSHSNKARTTKQRRNKKTTKWKKKRTKTMRSTAINCSISMKYLIKMIQCCENGLFCGDIY